MWFKTVVFLIVTLTILGMIAYALFNSSRWEQEERDRRGDCVLACQSADVVIRDGNCYCKKER